MRGGERRESEGRGEEGEGRGGRRRVKRGRREGDLLEDGGIYYIGCTKLLGEVT